MIRIKKVMRWYVQVGDRMFVRYGACCPRVEGSDCTSWPAGYYDREKNIIVGDPLPVTIQDGRTVYG